MLVGAVRVALEAAAETDGLVDPLLGDAAQRRPATTAPSPSCPRTTRPRPPCRCAAARGSRCVVTDTTVTVPRGAALDLGATGKAFAADLVALCVADSLGVPVLVGRRRRPPGRLPRRHRRRTTRCVLGHSRADLEAGGPSAWCASPAADWPPRASRPGAGVAAAASGTTSSTRAPACPRRARGAPSPPWAAPPPRRTPPPRHPSCSATPPTDGSSTAGSRPGSSTTTAA